MMGNENIENPVFYRQICLQITGFYDYMKSCFEKGGKFLKVYNKNTTNWIEMKLEGLWESQKRQ